MEVRRERKGKGKWDKPYGQGPDIFTEVSADANMEEDFCPRTRWYPVEANV